jgi:hypothetical protein
VGKASKGIILSQERRTAIFDLDRVIVVTAKYHYPAWKCLASELGFDFTETDKECLKVSRVHSLEILLEICELTPRGKPSYDLPPARMTVKGSIFINCRQVILCLARQNIYSASAQEGLRQLLVPHPKMQR